MDLEEERPRQKELERHEDRDQPASCSVSEGSSVHRQPQRKGWRGEDGQT
jgi:hypothetical protein